MQKNMFRKGLAFVSILLFVGTCVNISAVQMNSNINKDIKENCEIETLDEYTEIISFINGKAYDYNRKGFSVNISNSDIDIISYTTNGFYTKNVENVDIGFFIGYFYGGSGYIVYSRLFGVAIGNIKW